MLRLVYSSRTELLLAALAETLRAERAAGAHPLEPVELLVPNRNMERFVRLGLAEALGVAANLRFRRLERFTAELVAGAPPPRDGALAARLVDADALAGALLALFHDEAALAAPELAPVRGYLAAPDREGTDLRRVQLAVRLGRLFEEYAYSRPEMVAEWSAEGAPLARRREGSIASWQAALWRGIAGEGGVLSRHPAEGARWVELGEVLAGALPLGGPGASQAPLHVFGISYVARAFAALFERLAAERDVHLFTLNPCMEFWEDVESPAELRRRLGRTRADARLAARPAPPPEEDPYELFQDTGNLPLRLWGRPGREHVMLLNELTDCDFDARFPSPQEPAPTLLAALQRDVLVREPTPAAPATPCRPDGSLRVLACPDPRREVEAVADAIWQIVREPPLLPGAPPLTFSDVAVIVSAPARDRYLPHLQAAFAEHHDIPSTVTDLPLAAERPTVEAARLLLELPFGRRSRAEMLRVMLHPAVRGPGEEAAAEEWAELAAELGIFHGASQEDLADTYVEEDLLSWDQGLRRLALGAFLAGPRSGEERRWQSDGREVLVADVPAGRLAASGRFALLARSLLADAEVLRRGERTLSEWAATLRRLLTVYLAPPPGEEGDLQRCLGALGALERLDVAGARVSGRTACALASAALGELTGGGAGWLAEGVAVSTLLPMRAIPFRAVFLLGLGEGEFPAANRRDALDLRASGRRPGDVTPAERDRYLFLETLLSARERLVLSFVSRDERTGEALRPSSVVQELLGALERGYLGKDGAAALVEEVPPRRWDRVYFPELGPAGGSGPGGGSPGPKPPPAPNSAPGALQEAAAARLGEELLRPLEAVSPAALAALAERLRPGEWRTVHHLLALPALPAGSPSPTAASGPPRPLQLRLLRTFLECPMQTSAALTLGLAREDEDDPSRVEDESFRSARKDEVLLLRDAMALAARRRVPPERPYLELARRRELAGQMPTGVLGEIERELHLELLAEWHGMLADRLAQGPGERLRLGRAPEREDFDLLLPAVEVALAGSPDGGPLLRQVHGRSELLLAGRRCTVICDPAAQKDKREERVRLLRLALRGLCDHLLLAASGTLEGEPREVVLLRRGQGVARLERQGLAPLSRAAALAYLATLGEDLVSGVHAYLLPCEAVLQAWVEAKEALPLDPEAVAEAARQRLANDRAACSSRWGPVPEPELYAPPPPEALRAMLARRWEPLLLVLAAGTPGSVR